MQRMRLGVVSGAASAQHSASTDRSEATPPSPCTRSDTRSSTRSNKGAVLGNNGAVLGNNGAVLGVWLASAAGAAKAGGAAMGCAADGVATWWGAAGVAGGDALGEWQRRKDTCWQWNANELRWSSERRGGRPLPPLLLLLASGKGGGGGSG
jgi:hypothetical protein